LISFLSSFFSCFSVSFIRLEGQGGMAKNF
jgi:hypothetical protein